jgi:hypothetical protein
MATDIDPTQNVLILAPSSQPLPKDPARALRRAARNSDALTIGRVISYMLDHVPLPVQPAELLGVRVVRRGEELRDPFTLDPRTRLVISIHRRADAPALSVGDLVVLVDGRPLLGDVALAGRDAVVELSIWRGVDMASLRRRLARDSLSDGLLELARHSRDPPAAERCAPVPAPAPAPAPVSLLHHHFSTTPPPLHHLSATSPLHLRHTPPPCTGAPNCCLARRRVAAARGCGRARRRGSRKSTRAGWARWTGRVRAGWRGSYPP